LKKHLVRIKYFFVLNINTLIIIFILFFNLSFSQNTVKIDSLKKVLQNKSINNDDLFYNIAIEYYNINFDSVLFYTKKAREYSIKKSENTSNTARYSLIIGVAYKNIGKPDSAIFYYNESIKIFEQLNNYTGVAAAKNNLGLVYSEIGKYKQANKEFVESISFFEKEKDTLNIAEVYLNLGSLCTKIKCYDKAFTYFLNAREKYKLVNSSLGEAFVYSEIANLKVKENNLDTALIYYFKAENIWAKVDRKKEIGKIYTKVGSIYKTKKQYQKAIKYLQQSIINFKSINYQYGIAESSELLGSIFLETGKTTEAKKMFNIVIDLSGKIEAKSILSKAYKNLYFIEKKYKNFEKSLIYYEKYNKLEDELFNIENNKNIVEIQSKYDVLVNQKKIENLRNSTRINRLIIEKNKLKAKQQRNLTLILFVSVILAILLVLVIYYRFIKNKKLSKELYIALNDREVLLKELHHRVKNNLQIISSLLYLQSNNTKNKSVDEILQVSRNRISTMLMIHEKLYKSKNFKSINLREYISDLSNNLLKSSDAKNRNIKINIEIQEIDLDINKLIPCGLIVNELITNSLKHAFKGEIGGNIYIKSTNYKNICTIKIIDDGVGLPDNFDINKTNSLGLRLVTGLAKQIDGTINIDKTTNGSIFFITFNV